MRALVTGSGGFVGAYLVKSLEKDGWTVTGFDLHQGNDIRSYEQIRNVVEETQPEEIYHLAAVAWPGESISDPRRTFDVNVTGALNLLEAVRHTGCDARILLAGTSEEYGYEGWPDKYIITENSPCFPTTPYGVSKLAQTTLGMTYRRRHYLPVVATRAFNHTGYGRQAVNAESAFARRIVAFERGEAEGVEHGDLSSYRNFTNVRDVVRAYRLAIRQEPGIYNIASLDTVKMERIMETLCTMSANTTGRPVPLRWRASLGRSDGLGEFPGINCNKLRICGWAPEIPLAETLAELLTYWRSR